MDSHWLIAARAIHILACLWVAGWLAIDRLIARACVNRDLSRAWRFITSRALAIAVVAAAISGVAWFALVTQDMSQNEWSDMLVNGAFKTVALSTQFGRLWILRAALLLCVAVMLRVQRENWITLGLSVLLVASLAWAGHGLTGRAAGVHLPSDALHLVASAMWPTGLLPLLVLMKLQRSLPDGERRESRALAVRRFSTVSLASVASLSVTGLVNSACLLPSWNSLIETRYGRLLLLKVWVFVMMVGIGAVNLLRLKPRIPSEGAGDEAARELSRNVVMELLGGFIVILVVAMMGVVSPGDG